MRASLGLALIAALVSPSLLQAQATVSVDAAANRRAISPLIYGIHFGDSPTLLGLQPTVNRPGGSSAGHPLIPPPPATCHPASASVAADGAFQQGWAQHVKDTFGAASAGGLKYWGLDNEPTIWHHVYWDVHPSPSDTAEMRTKMIDYGSRIKSVDPTAQVLGPEEWGWDAYFYSGKDQELLSQVACNGPDCPDRLAQGGLDYTAYLLDQLHQYEAGGGGRILDMLT